MGSARGMRGERGRVWRRVALGAAVLSLSGYLVGARAVAPASAAGAAGTAGVTVRLDGGATSAVAPDRPLDVAVSGGRLTGVTVTDAAGRTVPGTLNAAADAWTPAVPLDVAGHYRADVAVRDPAGRSVDRRVAFTTLTPARHLAVTGITPAGGATVGTGEIVSVTFAHPVTDRAEIQRALTVTSDPAVAGAWHWFGDQRVDWRPRAYWSPGTVVTVHADFDGVSDGSGRYGSADYAHTFTIGSDVRAVVDPDTHSMAVYQDGRLLRTLPADTGRTGYSTWGGTMVVLDKQPVVTMTSCSVGISCDPKSPNYYDLPVHWDVHLTDSGTYVHDASWDTAIGVANTSHGCVHLTAADAAWFYGLVKPGDTVRVLHEPRTVAADNGFGDWNLTWSQWLAGSA